MINSDNQPTILQAEMAMAQVSINGLYIYHLIVHLRLSGWPNFHLSGPIVRPGVVSSGRPF